MSRNPLSTTAVLIINIAFVLITPTKSSAWDLFITKSKLLDRVQEKSFLYNKCKINQVYQNECKNIEMSKDQSELECTKNGIEYNRIIAAMKLGESQAAGDENNSLYNRLTTTLRGFPYLMEPTQDNYRIYHPQDCRKKSIAPIKYYKMAGYRAVKLDHSAGDKKQKKKLEQDKKELENELYILKENAKQLRSFSRGEGYTNLSIDKLSQDLIETEFKILDANKKIEVIQFKMISIDNNALLNNKLIYYAYIYTNQCTQYDDFPILQESQLYNLKRNKGTKTKIGIISEIEIKTSTSIDGINRLITEDSSIYNVN